MFVFVSQILLPVRCSHKNWCACLIAPCVLNFLPVSSLLTTVIKKSINYDSAHYVLSPFSGCFQIFFCQPVIKHLRSVKVFPQNLKKKKLRINDESLLQTYHVTGLRVQTRPKPLDFSGVKILSMPSSGGKVKESQLCGM